uniref:Kinesin family member 26Aa n=1 Tax=Cyprinodon variegatus TaxID=28743 RepID=A0A3Q2DEE6_CYPVA
MVRICSSDSCESSESMSFLKVDGRKKQLTLIETSNGGNSASCQRRSSASAPKTFTFDAVFTQDASQAEVCSGTVAEVIQSVVNGADGCIFCYGHANLGKTYTMIGRDCSTQSLGVAPTAISWLFKVIEERREKSGARFSVRVSAVEISGREETLTDLLTELSSSGGAQQEAPGPAVSLREDPVCGSQLQNQTELRASSAERAAFFLDAALAERRSSRTPDDQDARRNSHFLFTLHLYQERSNERSLGSCGVFWGPRSVFSPFPGSNEAFLDLLFRDSKLTMLLSESLGNINCRTTMIAHISDLPANYMETLTTVQLASRIHRMRKKKSKYASSSSGGDSSCEEGTSHRPPHVQPLYPRIVALDPETPLLLSNDPDYSSSSEQSCDTVIYVGPGGIAISDRELSDNEGPPSFVPIIPSLNKKRTKDSPRSDGDHFKCNTFAELQERLDCIDGSEAPNPLSTESRATQAEKNQTGLRPDKNSFLNLTGTDHRESGLSSPGTPLESSKRTSADGEKLLGALIQPCLLASSEPYTSDPEPVVREKVRGGVSKSLSPQSLPQRPMRASDSGEALSRTPPVGMSYQVSGIRAALLGRCLDRDFLRTTITLQQPVELNGEDELVFTVIEELPLGLVPDNGRPSNLLSFNPEASLQSLATGSRPVSIISSINDEYDAYTTQHDVTRQECHSSAGSQPVQSQDSNSVSRLLLRDERTAEDRASVLSSPNIFHRQPFLQHGLKSSLNDSGICFSELDSDPTTPSKPSFTKASPFSDPKVTPKGPSKVRANILNTSTSAQISQHSHHSSLPRKTKPTSSAALGSSRREDFWFQGSDFIDQREVEFISGGKQTRSGIAAISPKRSGGNSNSVPRPPKVQGSSTAQRVVDGCEKSTSRRGDTLVKLPKLTRGATTLGTVSTPHSSEVQWDRESAGVTGTLRYSSLGKKANGQKSSMISKSGSGSISSAPLFARQSSQEQKTRSPSALKTSNNGKFPFPKSSASEEEFTVRLDHDSARTSSLKIRGAKADPHSYSGSLRSLERCDSPTSTLLKPEVFRDSNGAGNGISCKSNRSVPKLGLPPLNIPTCPQASSTFTSTASKLGQLRGNVNSRGAGGLKVRTLSTSSSKSLSSSPNPSVHNANLPPTGKSLARAGNGIKTGRGTIMGTKQVISRAANSRVSELAAGQKQLSRGAGESESSDCGMSSVNKPLPSPYSKITPPRRPQRYSSGHGSDNSSILSGELPPAMGRTALFYHSGGSSGYESMIRDSETTGSTSSAHDSMSESGVSLSNRGKVSKSPKKRGNGRRMRSSPFSLTSGESDIEEKFLCRVLVLTRVLFAPKGLLYFNARLRMLERRQQQIRELRSKHERLKVELEEAKIRLMLHPSKWSGEFDLDQDLDRESQEYLEALAQATADLEYCVNLCKSRVMMETCFDISITTTTAASAAAAMQDGHRRV